MSRRSFHTHRRIPSHSDQVHQPNLIIQQKTPRYEQATTSRSVDNHETLRYYQIDSSNGQYYSYDSTDDSVQNHYENDESLRRFSRTTFNSEREKRGIPNVHQDVRRIYPNKIDNATIGWRLPATRSRSSDRPQSSMSSGVTSTIVDGCGGKCQTFENVCYFFLQLVFMMGILIGVSLCIAGLVLRKSAARNLQVLVYIGAMLATVSGALLGIQWNARSNAKKRRLAVRNSKTRAPIPLENLQPRQQVPLMTVQAVQQGQRVVTILRPTPDELPDVPGVPWWRRRDLR